ncbi:MAG: hypothetical protein K0R39_3599 [Symbiobacteriaceae bacterium]|jgi:hypothetical protein|nr:hypothetical protein [Symbiobacteriaceae bacterium]
MLKGAAKSTVDHYAHAQRKEGTRLAVTMISSRRRIRHPWQLYGCVALTLGAAAGCVLAPTPATLWASLGLLPLSGWCGVDWVRATARRRAKQSISARLSRLPDDFYLLNDLTIPAPWGNTHIDHIILSRWGMVVVTAGADSGWMLQRVEAVRTLLFTNGLLSKRSVPMSALVLLPPGAPLPERLQSDGLTIRVEHLRLNHLAPSNQPVLAERDVAIIAQCLFQARAGL